MQKINTSISSIIDEFGQFISKIEENHKRDSAHLTILSSKLQTDKIYELNTLQLTDSTFPFEISVKENIQNFLESGVLKNIDHHGLQVYFHEFIHHKKLEELIELLFWLFLIIKFPTITVDEVSYNRILKDLRKKISNDYVVFIISLPQHHKENLLNLIIFSEAYIILLIFCKHFSNEKPQISNRFLLDIFHIILFELNGVCVSDYYVQKIIEKVFTSKFLHFYKEYGSYKKLESPHKKPKNFLGKDIIFPENANYNHEIQSFSHDLTSILYKNHDFNKKNKTFIKESPMKKDYKYDSLDRKLANSELSTNKSSNFFNNSVSSMDENTYSKMKFDCSQISPTISNVIENCKMSLPLIKKTIINHPIDKLMETPRYKNPMTISKHTNEKNQISQKKKPKDSVLAPYNYTVNDLTDDYKTESKHLKDLYEMKYVLDSNQQNTSQFQSSRKILENAKNYRNKQESEYLLDKGYSAFSVEALHQMKERELATKRQVESLKNLKTEAIAVNCKANETEIDPNLSRISGISPKMSSVAKLRQSNLRFKSIVNASEKVEEKINPYEIIPPRKLNVIIFEKNNDLEEEKEKNRIENQLLELAFNDEGPKMCNYKDNRKKYKGEHSNLIKGNIDTNINNIVNNILQRKDNAVKNMLRIGKSKKNMISLKKKHT